MNLNHIIFTEPGFQPPNWTQGLENVSIVSVADASKDAASGIDSNSMVWILSGTTNWVKAVRHYSARQPVIVLSKLTSLPEMQKALEAGARGYVEVLAHPSHLRKAAESVSRGGLWIAAPMLGRLLNILSSALPNPQEPPEWKEKLSKREREVAEIVAKGASNREVAEQLHISVRTVKEHLTSIFSKLGVPDRLHLILLTRGEIPGDN